MCKVFIIEDDFRIQVQLKAINGSRTSICRIYILPLKAKLETINFTNNNTRVYQNPSEETFTERNMIYMYIQKGEHIIETVTANNEYTHKNRSISSQQ